MPLNYQTTNPTQFQRIPSHTRDEAFIKEFLHKAEIGHIAHSDADQPFE